MDIPEILHRFANSAVTEQEAADFSVYLQTLTPDQYSELMETYGKIVQESAYQGTVDSVLLSRIERRMDLMEQSSALGNPRSARPIIRKIYWRAGIAAACLLVVTGIYLFKSPFSPVTVLTQSIAPGGNKAVLTLGNGTKIVLDSAANGKVANQGVTMVLKLSNGQLAYQPGAQADTKAVYNTLETPRGGEYQLLLPDGTTVWLNSASSIRYPTVFTGKDRTVEVTGEAYFEVAKDPSKPFFVSGRGTKVQVLGTEFNLMAYADEETIRTTLVNGSVQVVSGEETKQLQAGEQAAQVPGQAGIQVSRPDLREVLAWKEGSFRFNNAKITTIMRQVARWYDVDISYEGTPPPDDFYCVISKKKYASQILDILEQTENVHFTIDGKKIIVHRGPK